MSTSKLTSKNNFQSGIMSFIGMMVAIPASLAIFSSMQPAQAMQQPQSNPDYAQYSQAYAAGLASAQSTPMAASGCAETTSAKSSDSATSSVAPKVVATSAHRQMVKPIKKMTPKQLSQSIHNSYKQYVTNVKNINSNNTVKTSVNVSNSNGAVVSTSASVSGDNKNDVDVHNYKSNNNVGSYNTSTDSHNVTIKDSFNRKIKNTTDNTTIIKDSFNHKVDVDIKDSGNTVTHNHQDNSQHVDVDLKVTPSIKTS